MKNMFAGADNNLFQRAKELRKAQTFGEELLWNYLRTKPGGFKFRRQHPFSIYILDFYCHALNLVIEVDGSIHDSDDAKTKDAIREHQLKEYGLTILRFTNDEVKLSLDEVIKKIEQLLNKGTLI